MAKATGKKPRKNRAKTQRHRDKVGDVSFYEYSLNGQWGRWRVDYRGKHFGPKGHRRTYDSKEEAEEAAIKLNEKLQLYKRGKKGLGDELDMPLHTTAQIKLGDFNSNLDSQLSPVTVPVDIVKAVEVATEFLEAIVKVNGLRQENQKSGNLSVGMAISEFQHTATRKAKRDDSKYSERIDKFLKWKCGKHGSKRGRTELSPESKTEWKRYLGLMKKWVGNHTINEGKDSKNTVRRIQKGIDEGKDERNGKQWSQLTKRKAAQKMKEFGGWLVKEDYARTNPVGRLLDDYAYQSTKSVEIYDNEQVIKIFGNALQGNNKMHTLIPFLAITFFASVRPSDAANPQNPKRRMLWNQIKFDDPWRQVNGSCSIELKQFDKEGNRTSKTEDRDGLMFANCIEWLHWYNDTFRNGKPRDEMYWSRRRFDRLTDTLGFEWINDGARHTSTSCALVNWTFDGSRDFFATRYGNGVDVMRKHYIKPIPQARAAEYFDITPALVIKKFGIELGSIKFK